MSFEQLLLSDALQQGFGTSRYLKDSKQRSHISKSKADMDSNAFYLKTGESNSRIYDWKTERYLIADNLIYDFVLTLYDVDKGWAHLCRHFVPNGVLGEPQMNEIRSMARGRRNVEARLIGLQNNQKYTFVSDICNVLSANRVQLVEADLFGNEKRHIALDLKTGMS